MPSFFRYDGTVQDPTGLAIPGASVAVLTQPASFGTQPGSPLQAIYAANASNSATIMGATWNGGQITFQFSTTPPADVVAGSFIKVSGVTPSAYNTTLSAPYLVLSVEGNFVIVASLNNPGSYISGGTVATSVLPNPTASDGNGNYFFYAAPSIYSVQIYGPTIAERDYPDQDVGATGAGSVTSVSLTAPAQFTVGGSPITGAGTLALSWANENANLVLAGPTSGGAAAPTFRALVAADIPSGAGIVSSVAVTLTVPPIFTSSVTGSPITSSGTIAETIGLATQAANNVWAGPSSGSAATPTFRPLVAADVPIALPWIDIQTYGGFPDNPAFKNETTTATTIGGSQTVAIAAPLTFQNGQGVCIPKAGAATTQTTPSAPTASAGPIHGSQTITYKIVGYDSAGGLTAASASGQVTNAPAVFGPPTVAISSISLTSNVVTVNFASPLNNSVTTGMTIHIVGVTGAGSTWNGIFKIASAPTTSQITYAFTGANGSGTVSASSTGRVSNTKLVTAIARDATGQISITTDGNHGWQLQNTAHPTVVIIENCSPQSLNGHWTLQTASGNTATTNPTGFFSAVTGSAQASIGTYGTSLSITATVWECITVTCPALSGSPVFASLAASATYGYYIYSDSPAPGGPLVLIGKTLYQESHFDDWGQYFGGGYQAPAYVPTTAPGSAQNKLFTSTILSGAGTTSLLLANTVPTSIPTLGATIMHDDGPALIAAATARAEIGLQNGPVLLSPSKTLANAIAYYIFNSPINVPKGVDLLVDAGMIINETITWGSAGQTNARMMVPISTSPNLPSASFGRRGYASVTGLGNPMVVSSDSANIDGIQFRASMNGQNLVMFSASYSGVSNSVFDCEEFGNSIGLCFNGNCTSIHITDIELNGGNGFADAVSEPGLSVLCPLVGNIILRCSDNAANGNGVPPSTVFMDGVNTGGGRGILIDGRYQVDGQFVQFNFGDSIWLQAPATPLLMVMAVSASLISLSGALCDSTVVAALGNFCTNLTGVRMDQNATAGFDLPSVTGNKVTGLSVTNEISAEPGLPSGDSLQTVDCVQDLFGAAHTWGIDFTNPPDGMSAISSITSHSRPFSLVGPYGVAFSALAPISFTAVAGGSGSIAAGTYQVSLHSVGQDGGRTAMSPPISVTVNGSQQIQVAWTPISGMAGVEVNVAQSPVGQPFITQNAGSPYTTSSHNFSTVIVGGSASGPSLDGTGLPCFAKNLIITPSLIFPQGVFASTFAPTTLTAARAVTVPDAAGTLLIGSASGLGNGSPGSLSAPAHGTGGGPATPATIVGWTEINIAGTLYWIPLAQ